MKNFDQFEISATEMNNVEGGTFGLLGLLNNCAPKPTYCAPKPTYCAPKPTYCAPKPTPVCLPKISFSFSISFGGCKPSPCLPA